MMKKKIAIAFIGKGRCRLRVGAVVSDVLVSASKTVGRDDPSAPQPVPATVEYAYQYDDIGNRISSTEQSPGGSQSPATAYTANSLNQYTSISTSDFGLQTSDFTPQFDDDGNQTLIQTATGIWQVAYNGENRPILWELSNSSTPNYSTPLFSMSYDRMGRRVTKNDHRFTSDSWWNNISDFVSRLLRERQHYQNEPCTKCNSAAVTCFLRCYAGEDNEGERWFCPNGDHAGEFYDDWSEIPESCFQSGIKPYWPPDEDIPEPPHVPYNRPSVSEVVNGINNLMY